MPCNPMRRTVINILQSRDGLTEDDAEALMNEAQRRVNAGEDPEDVCYEVFELERDYAEALR